MQMILLAIAMCILGLAWKYAWQPAILGFFRDKLFDVRNELRAWVIHEGISLENPQYMACRMHINSCIRYLELYKFSEYFVHCKTCQDFPDVFELNRRNVMDRFASGNKKLHREIEKTLQRVSKIVRAYMVLRTFFLCFVFACVFVWEILKECCNVLCHGIQSMRPTREVLVYAMASMLLFLANTSDIMSHKYQDVIVSRTTGQTL